MDRLLRLRLRAEEARAPRALALLEIARPSQKPHLARLPFHGEAQARGRRRLESVLSLELAEDICKLFRLCFEQLVTAVLSVGAYCLCQRGGRADSGRHRHPLADAPMPVRVRPEKGPLGRGEHGHGRLPFLFCGRLGAF